MTIAAYQDILHRQRPFSKRPKMSVENRAKLFTPSPPCVGLILKS